MARVKQPERKSGKRKEPAERIPLGLRVTSDIKKRLDDAATASGRSQSQEAELRLESTFRAEHAVYDALDLAFGRRMSGLFLALANTAQLTGTRAVSLSQWNYHGGEDWMLDPYAYDQAVKAVSFMLETFRPKGDIVSPPDRIGLPRDAYARLGEGFARELVDALRGADSKSVRQEIADPIRARLADRLADLRLKPDQPLSLKK